MPFIAPVVGAAGSIIGGLLAKKGGAGKPSQEVQGLTNEQVAAGRHLRDVSDPLVPQGRNLLDLSSTTFQVPLQYWTSLLGGSRTGATSTMAPDINRILQGSASTRAAISSLNPRSGATPELNAASLYAPQKAISSLLQSVRPAAAGALTDIAGRIGVQGSDILNTGIGGLRSAAGVGSQTLNTLMEQEAATRKRQQELGNAIGNLAYLVTQAIMNRPRAPKSDRGSA